MVTLHRHHFARLLVAMLVVFSVLGLGPGRAAAQEKDRGNAAPQASQSLNGAPLRVVVQDDLAMEVYYEGRPQFFANDAGGTFLVVDGVVYGTDPPASGGFAPIPPTPIANGPVSGTGTAADPFTVVTTVAAGTTGVQLTQRTTYVNGEVRYRIQYTVANTGSVSRSVRVVHGADLYLNFPGNRPDFGNGFFDASSGAVGAASEDGSIIQVFIPGTPPTAYQEAFYASFWTTIGSGSAVGAGFNNTINPAYHDVAAGLQWDRTIAAGAQETISLHGAFGLAEVIIPPGEEPAEQPARNPANVTVAQRLTPNHAVARGSIVTHEIVVVNRGEGASGDATLTVPFDPAVVRVLDATFSAPSGWVSQLSTNSLTIRTGSLAGNGGRLVATLRFQVLDTAANGASLGNRISFRWSDQVEGGSGMSNLPIAVVGGGNDNRQTYTLSVTPASGPAGTVHQIDGMIFVPNEPVGVWYNTPDGQAVALDTYIADEEGNLFLDLSTENTPAGSYSLVMYGLWSEFTAVGPFTIE